MAKTWTPIYTPFVKKKKKMGQDASWSPMVPPEYSSTMKQNPTTMRPKSSCFFKYWLNLHLWKKTLKKRLTLQQSSILCASWQGSLVKVLLPFCSSKFGYQANFLELVHLKFKQNSTIRIRFIRHLGNHSLHEVTHLSSFFKKAPAYGCAKRDLTLINSIRSLSVIWYERKLTVN